jgi:hypothetical protein
MRSGARTYYLDGDGVGIEGFDAMLNRIDSDWDEHVTRTAG